MPRIAVCESVPLDNGRHLVINIIVAEASDECQEGCFHIDADYLACGIGWEYDSIIGDFVNPNPPQPTDEDGFQ